MLTWHDIYRDGWHQYQCPRCQITHAFATEICPYCGIPLAKPPVDVVEMTRQNYQAQFGKDWH